MLCGPHVRHLCSSETSKYVLLILSKCACLRSSTKCAKMSSTPVEEIVFEQHHTCRLVLLNNKELIARKCHCCPPNSTHCFVMIIFKCKLSLFLDSFDAGQHKTPEFLKLNPLGKLPVLKDGGFILTERLVFCTCHCLILTHTIKIFLL